MSRRRIHEHEIEIAASPEAVWRALTDAQAIAGWVGFEGGDTEAWIRSVFVDPAKVLVPGRHLVCGDRSGIFIEFFLAAGEGRTQVRMVHTGELEGSDWEGIYDAEYIGWRGYLANLRHCVERHAGTEKRSFLVGALASCSPREAFARLTGPGGLGADRDLLELGPGHRFEARSAAGDGFSGQVYTRVAGSTGLSFVVEGLNDALVHVSAAPSGHRYSLDAEARTLEDGNTYTSSGGEPPSCQAALVVNTWGLEDGVVAGLRDRTRGWFRALFPKDGD